MRRLIIASNNPVKIQAALNAFQRMFPGQAFTAQGVEAPGGVAEQPISDGETLSGAQNRTLHAMTHYPEGDFWIGIEGGVDAQTGIPGSQQDEPDQKDQSGIELAAFAWVVVLSKTKDGKLISGKGRTGTFFLPPAVTRLVRAGKELGEADDEVFGRSNSKQTNGAVGLLTGDVIDRARLYEEAVILALIPFRNAGLYADGV